MYQYPAYLPSTSPHTSSYGPRRSEYNRPSRSTHDQPSRYESRHSSVYQPSASGSLLTPAFYDLSTSKQGDVPSTSPYWIRSIPAPSTGGSSSPSPHSLRKRDAGNDTNIASLVVTGVIGTISISLQMKGNSLAAASYQLALTSRDAAINSAQAVGSGAVAASGRVGGAIGGGATAMGNAVGGAASGVARAGTNAVIGGVNAVGSLTSSIAQSGSNAVTGGMTALGTASRWLPHFPSLRFNPPSINPFRSSSPDPPSVNQDAEQRESHFPDHEIRHLGDGTLELSRRVRIAIIDENLVPGVELLTHDELVQSVIGIADRRFEIGSDTDTSDTGSDADLEEEHISMAFVDPIPMQENIWAEELMTSWRNDFG